MSSIVRSESGSGRPARSQREGGRDDAAGTGEGLRRHTPCGEREQSGDEDEIGVEDEVCPVDADQHRRQRREAAEDGEGD